MRPSTLTVAVLLISSTASAPLPHDPLVLEPPKASNGTSFKLERRVNFDTFLTNAKDVVKSTWAKRPWTKSGLDSNPSLSSQDSLALSRLDDPPHTAQHTGAAAPGLDSNPSLSSQDSIALSRLDDPPPTAQHTDAAAPKLSLTDKLKQMINKPVDDARIWLNDAGEHIGRHKLAYTALGLVTGAGVGVGAGCGYIYAKELEKVKDLNAKMIECDKALDRGEPVPIHLRRRDMSSDEDSVLEARSPKYKGSSSSGSSSSKGSSSGGTKKHKSLAKSCKTAARAKRYKPRHAMCKR